MLVISKPNRKLKKKLAAPSFDLPAGHSCPAAAICFGQARKLENGEVRIFDTPDVKNPAAWEKKYGITAENKFRCYAATAERMPDVYDSRHRNFDSLRGLKTKGMADMLEGAVRGYRRVLPENFRLHTSGDFFSEAYFLAWLEVARRIPEVRFYTYTKMTPLVVKHEKDVPDNLVIVLSLGGKFDRETAQYAERENRRFRVCFVAFNKRDAAKRKLPVDITDEIAISGKRDFCTLLHGPQPKGSVAMREVYQRLNTPA